MNLEEKINQLKDQVNKHNQSYYQYNTSLIPDADYDRLVKELKELEDLNPEFKKEDSPTQRVGGYADSNFKQVRHLAPMLSLTNNQDINGFIDTVERHFVEKHPVYINKQPKIHYSLEPKIDGLAINLTYIEGHLVHAVTRGDGLIGEDVTHTVNYIQDIPKKLKVDHPAYSVEIRGEIYMKKSVLKYINEQLTQEGKTNLANPRNAAAGTVRLLNTNEIGKRQLNFFAYAVGSFTELNTTDEITRHSELLTYLKELGFPINPLNKIVLNRTHIPEYIDMINRIRPDLDYDIDGVVIKVDELYMQKSLNATSKAPKCAIAFKLPPEEVTTKILDVKWQVGKTGAVTPVAILSPVQVNGVIVSRCTLHNYAHVISKGVMINDTVIIRRAGDVVPELVSVVYSERKDDATPVELPLLCPSCQSVLSMSDEKNSIRCNNGVNCPSQLIERLAHFVSRDVFNITGLGIKQIENLVSKKRLNGYKDIFLLTKDDVSEKVLEEINSSKKITLDKLFYSLGIFGVGKTLSKILINHYPTIEDFMQAKYNDLLAIPEIGKLTAERIVSYFADSVNTDMIHTLIKNGVYVESIGILKNNVLNGLNVVITGSFNKISRKKLTEILERHGAVISNTVTHRTSYLVVGDSPGSKLDKALELKVTILNENQILELI